MVASGITKFRPAFKEQADYVTDKNRFVGVIACSRGGKTYPTWYKFITRVSEMQRKRNYAPTEYWIIVPFKDLAKPLKIQAPQVIDSTMIDFSRQGRDTGFFNLRNGSGTVILRNGAIISFKSFEQGESLVASTLGGWWVDECARCNDEVTWANLFSRIATLRGFGIMSSSPAERGEFYYSVYKVNEHNPEFSWHSWNAYAAAKGGLLSLEEIEGAKKRLPRHLFEREFMASWTAASGIIYDCFGEHMITDSPPIMADEWGRPLPIHRIAGLDIGTVHPTAAEIVRVQGSHMHVMDELTMNTPSATDIVNEVDHLVRKYGLRRVYYDYAPGGMLWAREWLQTPGTAKNVVYKANKRVSDGISCVYQAMREGRLTIAPRCKNLIEELRGYQWDKDKAVEKPVKEHDDHCDAMRYAAWTHSLYELNGWRKLEQRKAA